MSKQEIFFLSLIDSTEVVETQSLTLPEKQEEGTTEVQNNQTVETPLEKEKSFDASQNGHMSIPLYDDGPVKDMIPFENFPWGKNTWLAVAWIAILIFSIAKETQTCNSAGFWTFTLGLFPILLLITGLFGRRLVAEHQHRETDSYVAGDIRWNRKNAWKYPAMASIAGVAASLLGVGGGMVTGPLMLELGVLPEVSRVTSSYMILFTSSCTTVQYLILGRVKADEALWFMVWGFIGAVLGHRCVEYLLKKYNSTSILVYILSWGVLISALAMLSVDLVNVITQGFGPFTSICDT